MVLCGKEFDLPIINKIRSTIQTYPTISRGKLSRLVCSWMNWYSPNGSLKQMSCRVALNHLSSNGIISLPKVSFPIKKSPLNKFSQPSVGASKATITCSLAELGVITIRLVGNRSSKLAKQWRWIMDQYHYLGSGPLCGCQLRYIVESERYGIVGGFSFNSASRYLKARDKWIGWTVQARKENINKVICNSRFLILPQVKVKNLASYCLSHITKCLIHDWEQRYGVRPLLLESFVDLERFNGTCYQAANWHYVGETSGRLRDGSGHCSRKKVYILPLAAKADELLCREGKPHELSMPPQPVIAPDDWAEEEFGRVDFEDPRLTKRLVEIARDFFARPQALVAQASQSRSRCKAAYRFFDNKAVTMEQILFPHYESTVGRCSEHAVVLAAQDTTSLNYTGLKQCDGLGAIGDSKNSNAIGLIVHDTMAFTTDGIPLGLLDVQCWARNKSETVQDKKQKKNRPIEEKESFKWIKSFQRVAQAQKSCSSTTMVSVGDREADLYELFLEADKSENMPKLLVRAVQHRRSLDKVGAIWDNLKETPLCKEIRLKIPRKGNCPSRTAHLELRFDTIALRPPCRTEFPSVALTAIMVSEINTPQGQTPLEWRLLTNVPTTTAEEAIERTRWYACRWGIEVFHKTLKSGCRIEQRQMSKVSRLESCLAVDMVVAWRIYHLSKLGQEIPDSACTEYFHEDEWKALILRNAPESLNENKVPTMREMIRMVASLGGFLGRKCDGEPGVKSLWLGLQRLDDITYGYRLALYNIGRRNEPP